MTRLIFAMWWIAVLADGAAAMMLAWEFGKRAGVKNHDARYSFILFFTLFISRVIRLYSFIAVGNHLPRDFAITTFVGMSVEAAGLWAFYLYVTGKFDGEWQDKGARFLRRIYRKVFKK